LSDIDGSQFEAPSPIPRGVSPGAKKFHLYRLIVSLYEQVASLRVTAHTHAPTGAIETKHFDALPPIALPAETLGAEDEYLYEQIVFVYEQVASLRAIAHGHAPTGVPRDQPWIMGAVEVPAEIKGKQFEAPSPLPRGVSPSYKDEHLYREIVRLYEQLASLRVIAHLHTKIGVALPR
jgi:hypothetical protein